MEILQEKIKLAVEKPDKTLECQECKRVFYIKKFEGKGELLVMAQKEDNDCYDIKCFGWLQSDFI